MDRRKSLKLLATGALATPLAIASCKDEKSSKKVTAADFNLDRNPAELAYEEKLLKADKYFTEHEMATIAVLADIIIPKDNVSGSATEAGVPAFIEFIVKDMPSHQLPMRGGLKWTDMYCLKKYNKPFTDCTKEQQMELVDQIAYPNKAPKNLHQGVSFFSLMRNLTATGFYTSQIGVKDIGYAGNQPTQWNGVPAEVLAQYKLAYTEKELKECISFDSNTNPS